MYIMCVAFARFSDIRIKHYLTSEPYAIHRYVQSTHHMTYLSHNDRTGLCNLRPNVFSSLLNEIISLCNHV